MIGAQAKRIMESTGLKRPHHVLGAILPVRGRATAGVPSTVSQTQMSRRC